MPQIQTGTVNVTNGSATVTGNGTTWLSDGIAPGAVFIRATLVNGNRVDDVVPYFVASVTSNEEIQLSAPYQGVTGTDQPYGITIDLTGTGLPLLGPRSIGSVPIFNEAVSVLDARLVGVEQTSTELGTAAFEDDERYLHVANNLSDLDDAGLARDNLGLGDSATADIGLTSGDVVGADSLSESATPATIPIRGAASTANEGTFEVADASEPQHPVTLSQFEISVERIEDIESDYYNTGNILGTVSQSGGVPTGAIIQRGSNANGQFIRLADGTMICTRIISQSNVENGTFATLNWTYPSQFISDVIPVVSPRSTTGTSAIAAKAGVEGFSNSSATVHFGNFRSVYGYSSAAVSISASIVAIGRWF